MTIYESELPGVGRKFELELDGGARLVVIVHHDGRREVFHRPSPDADSEKLMDLSDRQAGELATVLQGAHFETVDVNALDVPLGGAIIEWIEVSDDASVVGQTLEEAAIRAESGVSVIAVQRDVETIANPDADFTIEAGDVLVTLGTREHQAVLETMLE
ncbi:MAG: TrkA C-terminal domain-containing protein [Halobacteriales archaeon]|nr:TrkA C-terminal domain-containing protein [Halobacteriales archaeon]